MSKENSTAIAVVLDKSGSMLAVQEETIIGFNQFLEKQKKEPGEATLTLVLFDTIYSFAHLDRALNTVPPLNSSVYQPDGFTALYDSIAKTIKELGDKLAAKPESERPSKVIVVIITDGLENSSKEYSGPAGQHAIQRMIKHQEEKYSWEFLYIGAGIGALHQAQHLGIKTSNAAQYVVGNEGAVFDVMSASVGRGRGSGQSVGYTNAERKGLMDTPQNQNKR